MIVVSLIVIGVLSVINLILILKTKKKYIQVVDDYIVYNKKGVDPGKINIGDTILGKQADKFIIADVEGNNMEIGKYLSNSKTKKK